MEDLEDRYMEHLVNKTLPPDLGVAQPNRIPDWEKPNPATMPEPWFTARHVRGRDRANPVAEGEEEGGFLSDVGDAISGAADSAVNTISNELDVAGNSLMSAGRVLFGGANDAANGFLDATEELGQMIEGELPAGYLVWDEENGVRWEQEKPEGSEPFQFPPVPHGGGIVEESLRGITQFVAGMAMFGGVGKGVTIGKAAFTGGISGSLFDPVTGNLATMAKDLGIESELLDWLDSKVGEDADPAARLMARLKQGSEELLLTGAGAALLHALGALKKSPALIAQAKHALKGTVDDLKSGQVGGGTIKGVDDAGNPLSTSEVLESVEEAPIQTLKGPDVNLPVWEGAGTEAAKIEALTAARADTLKKPETFELPANLTGLEKDRFTKKRLEELTGQHVPYVVEFMEGRGYRHIKTDSSGLSEAQYLMFEVPENFPIIEGRQGKANRKRIRNESGPLWEMIRVAGHRGYGSDRGRKPTFEWNMRSDDNEERLISMLSRKYKEAPVGAAPDRTTFTLERFEPPKGSSARTQRFAESMKENPEITQRFMEVAREGEEIGRKWYNTEALRSSMIDELGEEAGDQAWREYMWLVGATSTGNKVPTNIRVGSYYFTIGEKELRAMSEELLAKAHKPPHPYGHKMQQSHSANVGKLVTGKLDHPGDPALNPKPRGFAQSLTGGTTNIAADLHFTRLMGMTSGDPAFLNGSAGIGAEFRTALRKKFGKKIDAYISVREVNGKPSYSFNAKKAVKSGPKGVMEFIKDIPNVWADIPQPNEYKFFEELTNAMAKEMGMNGPQFQASLWMGAGKKTGVAPESLDTFMGIFNRNLKLRAEERGITVEEVFKRFVNRTEPLMVPLATAAGAGAAVVGSDL